MEAHDLYGAPLHKEGDSMKALVTVASKHGGSLGIGEAIGDVLRTQGLDVDLMPPEDVGSLDGYDGVVVGSGVYMGRWLGEARDFVHRHGDELRLHPVWLFSSGPVGDKRDDAADGAEGVKHLSEISGRDHRVFAGRLEKEELGLGERAVIRMVHAPYADSRPWDEIRAWATEIAETIKHEAAVPA